MTERRRSFGSDEYDAICIHELFMGRENWEAMHGSRIVADFMDHVVLFIQAMSKEAKNR